MYVILKLDKLTTLALYLVNTYFIPDFKILCTFNYLGSFDFGENMGLNFFGNFLHWFMLLFLIGQIVMPIFNFGSLSTSNDQRHNLEHICQWQNLMSKWFEDIWTNRQLIELAILPYECDFKRQSNQPRFYILCIIKYLCSIILLCITF